MLKMKRISWKSSRRWFKLKYLLLLRAKGGPAIVARGFSIGLFVEMFTLPTFGLAFFLIFPLIYLFRASFAAALIGFVLGKIIYPLVAFMNRQVGAWAMPKSLQRYMLHHMPAGIAHLLHGVLDLIAGGMIVGLILALVAYFPVLFLLKYHAHRRKEKRRKRKAQLAV
jgi:uncharacterized protein